MAQTGSDSGRGAPIPSSLDRRNGIEAASHQRSPSRPSNTQPVPMAQDSQMNPRPRPASMGPPPNGLHQPQPVRQAVNSASAAALGSQVPPDLVAQVTEQVLNSLRMSGIAGTTPPPAASSTFSPPPQAQGPISMTSSNASVPPRNVYTPPSPDRDEEAAIPGFPNNQAQDLDGSSDKGSKPVPIPEKFAFDPNTARPRAAPRAPSDDATTLEKIWQPLFDGDGYPTARLGQFLRGLAIHIIEDYEPQRSLVISPRKMLRFYDDVKLPNEMYPWAAIFGGRITNSSLSHLYRDLQCQHHFVQPNFDDRPNIPALTPIGFERWMTVFIRAHPELEFNRFAKAVLNMPISNADNPKERFPKELSRRLFPRQANEDVKLELQDAVFAHPALEDAVRSSTSPPPRQFSPGSQPPMQPTSPPAHTQVVPPPTQMPPPPAYPRETSLDSTEDGPTGPIPIERERKPYHAQPGGGKVYGEDGASSFSEGASPRNSAAAAPLRSPYDMSDDPPSRSSRYRAGSASTGSRQFRRDERSPSQNGRQDQYRPDAQMPPLSHYISAPPASFDGNEEDPGLGMRYSRDERLRRYTTDERYYQPPPPPPPPPQVGSLPSSYPNYPPPPPRYP